MPEEALGQLAKLKPLNNTTCYSTDSINAVLKGFVKQFGSLYFYGIEYDLDFELNKPSTTVLAFTVNTVIGSRTRFICYDDLFSKITKSRLCQVFLYSRECAISAYQTDLMSSILDQTQTEEDTTYSLQLTAELWFRGMFNLRYVPKISSVASRVMDRPNLLFFLVKNIEGFQQSYDFVYKSLANTVEFWQVEIYLYCQSFDLKLDGYSFLRQDKEPATTTCTERLNRMVNFHIPFIRNKKKYAHVNLNNFDFHTSVDTLDSFEQFMVIAFMLDHHVRYHGCSMKLDDGTQVAAHLRREIRAVLNSEEEVVAEDVNFEQWATLPDMPRLLPKQEEEEILPSEKESNLNFKLITNCLSNVEDTIRSLANSYKTFESQVDRLDGTLQSLTSADIEENNYDHIESIRQFATDMQKLKPLIKTILAVGEKNE